MSGGGASEVPLHRFDTVAIHGGRAPEENAGAVVTPISLSAIYVMPGLVQQRHMYSRLGNPSREDFERTLAACEGAKYGFAFSSGMAAVAATLSLLSSGDHLLAMDSVYSGTREYLLTLAARQGISVTFFGRSSDFAAVRESVRQETRMVWCEAPSNPLLHMVDIQRLGHAVRDPDGGRPQMLLVVDNTFLSPYGQRPLDFGADLSMHSVTKYINGHSDVVMGAVLTGRADLAERLRGVQVSGGSTPSPFDCYLALRGLRTLGLRMRQHAANALAVAQHLERSDAVERVAHLGLASHPDRVVVEKQVRCPGGMVSFWMKGGLAAARAFLEAGRLMTLAVSLGGVETLAEHPASMTHKGLSAEARKALGITDGLIRLSVGIEDVRDIIADVERGLEAARMVEKKDLLN